VKIKKRQKTLKNVTKIF